MKANVRFHHIEQSQEQKKSTPRQRKPHKPLFGFNKMDFQEDGYRAMARCLGLTHRMLFDRVLLAWEKEATILLGFNSLAASKLSEAQIREIARRVDLAQRAIHRANVWPRC